MSGDIINILSQVNKLDKADQALLLKKLTSMVKKNISTYEIVKLSQISDLDSSIWHGIDIDDYVDSERQW